MAWFVRVSARLFPYINPSTTSWWGVPFMLMPAVSSEAATEYRCRIGVSSPKSLGQGFADRCLKRINLRVPPIGNLLGLERLHLFDATFEAGNRCPDLLGRKLNVLRGIGQSTGHKGVRP